MEKIKVLRDFHPCIDREKVFRQLNCYPDSPVYEEMEESFDEIKDEMLNLCKTAGVLALGRIPSGYFQQEREAVYVLVTIGQEISDRSTQKFAEGDFVQGMLNDAIADSLLFSLEDDIQRELRNACAGWKRGVSKRLEAPQDIPMEIQKEALKQTNAEELLGLELSSGYMFRLVKTSSQIYLTTDDEKTFKAQHNCRTCPNVNCQLRHVEPLKIRVMNDKNEEMIISLMDGTLLEALQKQIEGIQSPCGGRGACGKCRVQVMEGQLPVTAQDEKIFSTEELAAGWRLACCAVPEEDLAVRLGWGSEKEIEVQVGFEGESTVSSDKQSDYEEKICGPYGFAIDIGTTTLAVQLISLKTEECLGTDTGLNSQRTYGADVIARIQASVDGKGEELMKQIRRDLWKSMEKLSVDHGISMEDIERVVIAGNTTMIHLLMGYPCDGLGKVPFTPYKISEIYIEGKEVFPGLGSRTEIQIYPGISTFVGADIVSGICALHMEEKEQIQLLVDLGTNGEMVLGNREKLLVTSTAAGPAFEGGNITWGTGSIPGAVCNAHLENGKLDIQTIQGQPPVGICGTGVVELTAELVKNEEIDETGRLEDPWFASGFPIAENPHGEQICLTQKDVREIQLAKAAVRGGIETLLDKYGITAEQVQQVYVAGGFGYRLDYEKAMQIGMFPEEFSGKVQAVGNSSLRGAVRLLCDPERMKEAVETAALAEEIDLSTDPVFQEAYMDAMFFGEE